MSITRFAAVASALAVAVLAFLLLAMSAPGLTSELDPASTAPAPSVDRHDLVDKLEATRELRGRMARAESGDAPRALLPDSERLASAWIALMNSFWSDVHTAEASSRAGTADALAWTVS